MAVRIKLTDAVAVDINGIALDESKLGGRQPRLLLAVLVLERGRSTPRSHLAEVLWPDALPPSWEAALRGVISKVRAALVAAGLAPSEVLTVAFGCYQLHLPPDTEVDIESGTVALEAAEGALAGGEADEACRFASMAKDVGSRLFFAEHEGLWVEGIREHLRGLRLRALEILSEAHAARGEAVVALAAAEEAVRVEPLRESSHRCLMAAHVAGGNRGKALRAYEQCRRLLAEELGVDPSPQTEAAYLALLGTETSSQPKSPLDELHPFPASLPIAGLFIGRQVELSHLHQIEVQARSGRRQVVLLAGEAGMGKTALAAEVAAKAHDAGAVVLHGRCDKHLVPYEAFRDAFTRYWHASAEDDMRSIVQRAGAPIDLLVPEALTRFPDLDLGKGEPEADRHQLLLAATTFLRSISETSPVVLVIDDLHRAGAAELLLLRFLVRALEAAPVLIIGTYRSDELGTSETTELIAQLRRESNVHHILLGGLDTAAVELMVATWAGAVREAQDLPRRLWESTAGNPFFVGELLEHLTETEQSPPPAKDVRRPSVGGLPIPASVSEVVNHRRSRLSENASHILGVAAVAGRQPELRVLELACGMDLEAFLDALDEVVSAQLLDEVVTTAGLYEFRHDLVREVVYNEFGAARRRRVHARIGEALEAVAVAEGDLQARLADLAFHFHAAHPVARGDKALDYSLRAGAQAMEQLAFTVAEVHFEHALQHGLDAPGNEVLRCRTLMDLAMARRRSGRTDEAREAYMSAVSNARRIRDPEALAECAMELAGSGSRVSGWIADDVRISLLEEALEALAENDVGGLRTKVLADLTAALQRAEEDKERDSLARDALAVARELDEPSSLFAALDANQTGLGGPGNTELRAAYADEMVNLARGSGDPTLSARAHLARIPDILELGQRQKFNEDVDRARELALDLGEPAFIWRALTWDALRSVIDGSLVQAEDKGRAAAAVWPDSPSPDVVRCLVIQRATRNLLKGRAADGLLAIRSHASTPTAPADRGLTALLLAANGQLGAAAEEVERFAADGWVEPPFDSTWLFGMATLAEASARIGDADKAEVLYALLLPFADRMVVIEVASGGASFWGSASHQLGILAATMGRRGDAEHHLTQAWQANDAMGAKPFAARSYRALTRVRLGGSSGPAPIGATG